MSSVNINSSAGNTITNQINLNEVTVITDNNQISVTQPVTNVIEVITQGPQGPVGPQGTQGPTGPSVPFSNQGNNIFSTTSSIQITGSVNITGSLTVNTVNVGQNTLNFVDSNNVLLTSLSVSGNNLVLSTGSFLATQGGLTGSLLGTASWATNALTTSFAPNYVLNSVTSSFVQNSQTSSFVTNPQTSSFVQNSQTSSFSTGSFTGSFTGSLFGTASWANQARTASFINTLNQNVILTGSLTVTAGNNIELQVTNTGVTIGNTITDTHIITGSTNITGSVNVNGFVNTTIGGSQHSYKLSGYWYTQAENTSTLIAATTFVTGSATHNYVYLCPWIINRTQTFVSGAFYNNSGAQTINCVYGIYNSNPTTLLPQTLITGSSLINFVAAASAKSSSFATPITLTPGLYYVAFSLTGSIASANMRSVSNTAIAQVLGATTPSGYPDNSINPYTHIIASRSWADANTNFALPNSTTGTLDMGTFGTGSVYAIWFRTQ